MAPASARPFDAAVSVKFWSSCAVMIPSPLASISGSRCGCDSADN